MYVVSKSGTIGPLEIPDTVFFPKSVIETYLLAIKSALFVLDYKKEEITLEVKMGRKYKEGLLPFRIVPADERLVARSGLLLPYEMARALKLPGVIDKELPKPGSGRGYKPIHLR